MIYPVTCSSFTFCFSTTLFPEKFSVWFPDHTWEVCVIPTVPFILFIGHLDDGTEWLTPRGPCCCSEGPAEAGRFGREGPREVQQGQVQRPGCSPLSPLLWQVLGHTGLGDPQGWRLHHLSGQPVCFLSLFSTFIPIVPVLPQLLPGVINPSKQRATAAEARNIHKALQRALTSRPGALSGNK